MDASLYPEFVRELAAVEKKRIIIAPDAIAHSEGLACGDQLSIELSTIDGKCEFNVHVDGCLLCRASTAYMQDLLNEKSIQAVRDITVAFFAELDSDCSNREILGPWQTYKVPDDRKECVASPWRLLLAAINSLSMVCSTNIKMAPLACDACVQSHKVTWNHEAVAKDRKGMFTQFIRSVKVLRKLDIAADFRWQPLGKCILSQVELKRLQQELGQCTKQDIQDIKKLRLPALLYNNFSTSDSVSETHGFWLLVKKQRIRHYVTQRELTRVEEIIRLRGWRIVPVKGVVTSKLYESPAIRPHLDYDFVAASIEEAFALASWLMTERNFRFVTGGSVPFSLKVIEDNDGKEILTGHFHLEKIIDDAWQVVIDINFPGFPLSRTSLFPLTFAKGEPSWEEQLVITLCHIFKHELVFIKDINDAYLLLNSGRIDKQLLASHLTQHNLEFYYQLLRVFLEEAYNLPNERTLVYHKTDAPIIKWLLNQQWPYSRKAHFYAKAIDLVKRSRIRSGLVGAVRELSRQGFGSSPSEANGALGKKLGVSLNTRLYLFPVAIFKRYIQLPDMKNSKEDAFLGKSETIVPGHMVVVTVGEVQIVVTAMGLFLPTSELRTVGNKQDFTVVAKEVLANLNLGWQDLVIGATRPARPDLWLF